VQVKNFIAIKFFYRPMYLLRRALSSLHYDYVRVMKSFLWFRGSGLVTSSAAALRGKAPPPCSPFLQNGARGSPAHSFGSEHRPPASHLRKDIMTLH
jgi:hypothetical protein